MSIGAASAGLPYARLAPGSRPRFLVSTDDAAAGLEARGLHPRRDDTTSDKVRLGMLTDPDDEVVHLDGTPPMFFLADSDGNGLVYMEEEEFHGDSDS